MKTMRGAALLWVLWILMLGTTLVALALSATATHHAYSSLARRQSQADAAAEAGIAMAVWRLDPRSGIDALWRAGEPAHTLQFANAQLDIDIQDESAKIDVNQASVTLLQSYFKVMGLSEVDAYALAASIQDYRDFDDASTGQAGKESEAFTGSGYPLPANRPLTDLNELQQIPGFSDELLARTRDDLSVHSQRAVPQAQLASANVLAAMTAAGLNVPEEANQGAFGLYRIHVQVRPKNGPVSGMTAVVQLQPFDPVGHGHRMLSWNRTFVGAD